MAAPVFKFFRYLIFGLLFALLVLPAVQSKYRFAKVAQLDGYTEPSAHPDLSWDALKDNTYQPLLEHYLEERAGFREPLIRLRNQLAYSLFNVGRANNTVVGENNILFDANAIDANLGRKYIGDDLVRRYVYRFKAVQEALAKQGTLLVFAIAPGKATFYSEYWPLYYRTQTANKTISNYDAFATRMQAAGVNVVDFNQIFLRWKATAPYPLFSRGGIHWSVYGSSRAADTLFRYIEQRGHFQLPDRRFTSQEVTDQPRSTDNDLTKVLNLVWEPKELTLAYPTLAFDPPKPGQRKPNLLLVGDSFVWNLIPHVPGAFSEKSRFWYYNNKVDWAGENNGSEEHQVSALDRKADLASREVVLVVFSEQNLASFDFGFTNNAYSFLCPFSAEDLAKINSHMGEVRQDTAVVNRIWKGAHEHHLNPDDMFFEEAVSRFELEKAKP